MEEEEGGRPAAARWAGVVGRATRWDARAARWGLLWGEAVDRVEIGATDGAHDGA